jgi:hypothetical protein
MRIARRALIAGTAAAALSSSLAACQRAKASVGTACRATA